MSINNELVIAENHYEQTFDIEFKGKKFKVNNNQFELLNMLEDYLKEIRKQREAVNIRELTEKERKQLKMLCHPDKHNGSKVAEELFKKL